MLKCSERFLVNSRRRHHSLCLHCLPLIQ